MKIIYNALIVNEGKEFPGYITVDRGLILSVEKGTPSADVIETAEEKIDFNGDMLLPGVIDTHVHFRDGGTGSPKGDIESESRAASAGGVTTCFDMPNTVPPTVAIEDWEKKMIRAAAKSHVNYAFYIGATNSNLQTLIHADYSRTPGVKLFLGASTGNMLLDDKNSVRNLFKNLRCVIAVHAENQAIIEREAEKIRRTYGDSTPVEFHPAIRSREACIESVKGIVGLAKKVTTSRLHVLHISTAEEASMFSRGKVTKKRITAETCPHYLVFGGEEDYRTYGARIKCNPAIKEKSDSEALLEAIVDGRIDTIATDHAPHLPGDKTGGAFQAASGMPGVQFALPLMLTLSDRYPLLKKTRVVELMCHNPSLIFGIDRRGFLKKGYYADFVRVRPQKWTISDSDVVSKCRWTPYAGQEVNYRVMTTYINGEDSRGSRNVMPVRFLHNGND